MKVIMSRKGFDSKYGGCASPIFPDGSMFSLPIPARRSGTTFADVTANGLNMGSMVEMLTDGRLEKSHPTHLDPDIDENARPRHSGWMPAFGQVGGPLTHLDNCNVGIGDMFLFFGWFRRIEIDKQGNYRYIPDSRNLHVIFGWLQVGEMLDVGTDKTPILTKKPWLANHPHIEGMYEGKNRVYIAADCLSIPSLNVRKSLPGGGVFGKLANPRILTHPDSQSRSFWRLPRSFSPHASLAKLSCHESPARWVTDQDNRHVTLRAVSQGQEFVLEMENQSYLNDWLDKIFNDRVS